METVFKLQLPISRVHEIPLPVGATILCIREQRNRPVLYYRCRVASYEVAMDGTTVEERRIIRSYETGDKFQSTPGLYLHYIDTVIFNGGEYVLHYFEETSHA